MLSVLNGRPFRGLQLFVGQVNIFEMGLAIVSGIDANNLHDASDFQGLG
jgi:hypothetical protein